MAFHIELRSLAVDLLELRIEPDFLLLDLKNPVDILLFFSTGWSGLAGVVVVVLPSLYVLDSTRTISGPSWLASWTTPSSSERWRACVNCPKREERDLALLERAMAASILSLLSSSLGV